MPKEPLFYQLITTRVFETWIKEHYKEDQEPVTVSFKKMTYKKENAVRYIGGYIIRSLTGKLNEICSAALSELKGDESETPLESEEWTGSIDRGGLK